MKKFALSFFSGIIVTLACIGIIMALLFRPSTRSANCLPIPYSEHPLDHPFGPNDVTAFKPDVLRTKTSLQTVKDFYDTTLLHGPNWQDDSEGYWQRREVRPNEYLYDCFGTITWDETETGCIYLRVRDGVTIVERIWLTRLDTGFDCDEYISELPLRW